MGVIDVQRRQDAEQGVRGRITELPGKDSRGVVTCKFDANAIERLSEIEPADFSPANDILFADATCPSSFRNASALQIA